MNDQTETAQQTSQQLKACIQRTLLVRLSEAVKNDAEESAHLWADTYNLFMNSPTETFDDHSPS